MASPFDFINSVTYTKVNLIKEDALLIKDYSPFLVNRGLSYFLDTVFLSNEMNIHNKLDKDIQYKFFLTSINKSKRFSKWAKQESSENIELIKEVYKVNNSKALEILKLLTVDNITNLKKEQEKGGMSK